MLRALLRVGQRAVRIQLEHARAPGTHLSERVAAPRGGIPGFWVERQTVRDQGTVRSPVSVQDSHLEANLTVDGGDDSGLEIAPLPESALESAKPTAASECIPHGRSEDVKPREKTVSEARVESEAVTQPEVEKPQTEDIRKEPVEAEGAKVDAETALSTSEPVNTRGIQGEAVTTEPDLTGARQDLHTEAVETEPIKTDGQNAHNDATPTQIPQPSVKWDEVEQRPVRPHTLRLLPPALIRRSHKSSSDPVKSQARESADSSTMDVSLCFLAPTHADILQLSSRACPWVLLVKSCVDRRARRARVASL